MTKKVYQPVYDNGEPYEGFEFRSNFVYLDENDALSEIKKNGFTKEEKRANYLHKEKKEETIYRTPQPEDGDNYYVDNEFAYIVELEIK